MALGVFSIRFFGFFFVRVNGYPLWPAGNGKAAVRGSLPPRLTLTKRIAVALVVVAGHTRRLKVCLKVTRQFERSGIALEQTSQTSRTARDVVLAGVPLGSTRIRSSVERGIDIGV